MVPLKVLTVSGAFAPVSFLKDNESKKIRQKIFKTRLDFNVSELVPIRGEKISTHANKTRPPYRKSSFHGHRNLIKDMHKLQ